ncbi:MAG: cupin domain-containing protein [Bacilli bacterium]|nr:cupin domain-containing protein [Bacilli bacterium]MDD4808948.1 cupin domain-containing protein [Bacilli bacterium]
MHHNYPMPSNDNIKIPVNYYHNALSNNSDLWRAINLRDYGPNPFVINIEETSKKNNNFRTALWTGKHLQITLMSIPVNGEIGLEMHPDLDQFIRLEDGEGQVKMGDRQDNLNYVEQVKDDFAFIIPAGKWHNLINTGNKPIKLYSIYAPPAHPYGTVHRTKAEAEAAEMNRYYPYGYY